MTTFKDLAQRRFSLRKFAPTSVEKEKVEYVLEAARLARTAVNYQPQRILVLDTPETLAKLKDCTRYHFDAPLALIVCYDTRRVWTRRQDGYTSGDVDATIVATHLMLAATDAGLGSTFVLSFDPAALTEAYRIPAELHPLCILPMGYPHEDARPAPQHDNRFPLSETVFHNDFPAWKG